MTRNTATSTATHVAIYLRISKDREDTQAGVGRQREDCLAIAASRWPHLPVEVYEDNDISAYTGKRRPRYQDMLTAIAGRHAVAVVAYNVDRLLRQPRELEALIDLSDTVHLRDLVTAQGDLDLTSHDGRLMARVLAAVAVKSSDDTSRRIKRAHEARRAQGLPNGPLPYGIVAWDGSGATVAHEAQVLVETAYTRLVAGDTFTAIFRWAAAQDPTSPQTRSGWRFLLRDTPLLDSTQRATVRAILNDPTRRTSHSTERRYWLSGIMRCGVCGGRLRRKQEAHLAYWRCVSPGSHVSAPAAGVDAAVELALFEAAEALAPEPELVMVPDGPTDADVQARLDLLSKMFVAGNISESEWLSARDEAMPAAATVTVPRPSTVANLEAEWPDLDVHQRHVAARSLLVAVDLNPAVVRGGRTFDPSRLGFAWREGPGELDD